MKIISNVKYYCCAALCVFICAGSKLELRPLSSCEPDIADKL